MSTVEYGQYCAKNPKINLSHIYHVPVAWGPVHEHWCAGIGFTI